MAEKENKQLEANETQISFIKEDGTEELCQILFTFSDEVKKKNYMFFYPIGAAEEADEDEELEVYCATYEEKNGEICNIKEVDSEDEEENKMIQEVFEQYIEDCECEECDCEDGECDCEDEHCECHCHHNK